MSANKFFGQISEVFAPELSTLKVLDLSGNLFTGIVEPLVPMLGNLTTLALSSNCFTGTISSRFLCNLNNVEYLYLDGLSYAKG